MTTTALMFDGVCIEPDTLTIMGTDQSGEEIELSTQHASVDALLTTAAHMYLMDEITEHQLYNLFAQSETL